MSFPCASCVTLFKPLCPSVEQGDVLLPGPLCTGLCVSVVQVSMAQAVAGGANSAGDMLFGPVVFITRKKSELLGQKSRCVPKAEHQVCKTHVPAPMSLQGGRVVRAGDLLLCVCVCVCVCLCVHIAMLGDGPINWKILKLGSNSWRCQDWMAPWRCYL